MTSKLKLHLLTHLRADIVRFGPLVGVATEVFECFNAIFRYCSIFSNHLTPSRDIAFQLASQEALKHRLTGGWWPTADRNWDQPGPSIRNFIHDHPTLQALVGWNSTERLINGIGLAFNLPLSLLMFLRYFQIRTAQARCESEGGGPDIRCVVSNTRCQGPQPYLGRSRFPVDTVSICCCPI